MNIGIFNFLQFNSLNTTLLIMDKATDTYEIVSGNNVSYNGKRINRKSGYTKYNVGGKEELIYTADYLKYDEPAEKAKRRNIVIAAMGLVSAVLYLTAFLMRAPLSSDSLTTVGFCIALPFILYLLYTIVVKLRVPETMKLYEFEVSSYRMGTAALASAVALTVGFLLMTTCALAAYDFCAANITALCLQIAAAVVALTMYFVEKKRAVVKVPNKYIVPEKAEKVE